MLDLFNTQAADSAIAGVVTPSSDGLADCIKGWTHRRPFRVCGGGTTSAAAQPQAWSVDMRPGFHTIDIGDNAATVTIGAGCGMAEVLERLATVQRTLPAGLSGHPGIGYVLTGGMGPLSRRHGLAIDQLQRIRGVWGNGDPFELSCPSDGSSAEQRLQWRGLCGAAPFLGVVTDITINTLPLQPLRVHQASIEPEQLPQWMQRAEQGSLDSSLQWSWGEPDTIRTLVVQTTSTTDNSPDDIEGLHRLPGLSPPPNQPRRLHAEVVGLLGPACGDRFQGLINPLRELMDQRPDPGCQLACQQLGGATAQVSPEVTSFVHRDAIWKPWITATWPAGNARSRETSLQWLQEVWAVLEPVFPGIHLAQLHDHLPWHQRELTLAFGRWLPQLRALKQELDPDGNLPAL